MQLPRARFQSDVNNYPAIVTLPFPKHCTGRNPSQSHSFISGVFFFYGTWAIKVSGTLTDVWQRFPRATSGAAVAAGEVGGEAHVARLQPHVWGPASREAS